MRIYFPSTLTGITNILSDRYFIPISNIGFALTSTVQEYYISNDDEELTDLVFREAALASIRLISAELFSYSPTGDKDIPNSPKNDLPAETLISTTEKNSKKNEISESNTINLMKPRRVVISAEVSEGVKLYPNLDISVVKVTKKIPLESIIAVYVDLQEAEQAVLKAAEVIDEADFDDEDAQIAVEDAQDYELAWYAPEEIPFLLDLL